MKKYTLIKGSSSRIGFELAKNISKKKYINKNGTSFVFISSAARWITGTNLTVDGGYSAR